MTDAEIRHEDTDKEKGAAETPAAARAQRRTAPIVPPQNIAGRALVLVIAIMTFLSCLTLGAVTLVRDTASVWENQISREATIQIKPADGLDMEAALEKAAAIAGSFPGVSSASIVDREATARLLEPWLGAGLNIDELPVPRLIIVTIEQANPPDFSALRAALAPDVPGATLDDHRTWVDRLVTMARTTVTIGIAVLGLMLAATVLSVVFATRGAMAGNGHIIEVLHFVGAEAGFIAGEFRRHFLLTGMKGATAGGLAAIVVFIVFSVWSARNLATPQADQATALFGNFAIGASGYAGVALIVLVIGALTAATSHLTVVAYLTDIDVRQPELGIIAVSRQSPKREIAPTQGRNSGLIMEPMKGHQISGASGEEPESGEFAAARKPPRRLVSVLQLAGFAVLGAGALFFGGFGWFATHVSSLETPHNPPDADAIIVLTGGQARLGAAIDLLKSGKGKRLLISGVHPAADSDDLRAATGGDRKLFSCCVDIDHAALDTIGNAEESAKWVRSHDYGSIILVTNNYHMPRSLLEMGRLLGKADLKPYPVVNTRLDDGGWMVKPEALRVLFTEYNKYLLALARGVVSVTQDGVTVVNASTTAVD